MNVKFPLFYPYMNDAIKQGVADTLKTRWLGQGPQVDEFEKEMGKKFHQPFPISTNSGTAALEMAYELLGIKAGDEVLVPVLTCTATNIPLLRRKAKLVFVDVDEKTLCPDWTDVLRKMTDKTKAVVTVDLGGIRCGLTNLDGVPVIQDAAQALGFFDGDYVTTSFQAIKFFTTGDGGMLFVKDDKDYRRGKKLRWFGIDREKKRASDWQAYKKREMTSDIEEPGFKWQMTDIAASMGRNGLKAYDKIISHRTKIFNKYAFRLKDIPGIKLLDATDNLHWLATVLVENRDDFVKKLTEHGVETNTVQLRNDIFKVFGGKRQDLPNMNALEDKYLCLPINTHISEYDVEQICKTIRGGW
jgi:dTDP-4-amino-4,6-dideoxygalactose transaminase